MIAVSRIISYFIKAYNEKWGYILGASGQICTQALIDYSAEKWPDNTATLEYGRQWLDRRVNDCSGMFYDSFKENGGYIPHGSNSIWDGYLTKKGEITPGIQLRPGTAVFLRRRDPKQPDGWDYHHMGLFIGNGEVIEAKGTRWGVVKSKLEAWDCWGELKGVKYEETEVIIDMPVICQAMVKTSGGILNLRDAPGGRDIGDIPNGAAVDVLEKTATAWWKVTYKGAVGWVSVVFLVEVGASSPDTVAVVLPRSTWEVVRDAINAVLK